MQVTHGFQVAADGDTKTAPAEPQAVAPTSKVKVEAADLSQLAIQDPKVVAAAEAHVVGTGYKAPAAALGPAMRTLSTSSGLGFAHSGALAGVGKGQRVKLRNDLQSSLFLQILAIQCLRATQTRASGPLCLKWRWSLPLLSSCAWRASPGLGGRPR